MEVTKGDEVKRAGQAPSAYMNDLSRPHTTRVSHVSVSLPPPGCAAAPFLPRPSFCRSLIPPSPAPFKIAACRHRPPNARTKRTRCVPWLFS